MTFSRFCFCGDSAPVAAAVANNPNCQEVCTGDPASKCGGLGYVSLYSSAQPITGLTISSDAAVVVVGSTITFNVGVTSGSEVYYQMDYDDGAGLSEKNATGFNTRQYYVPGTYSVIVEANDLNDTLTVSE